VSGNALLLLSVSIEPHVGPQLSDIVSQFEDPVISLTPQFIKSLGIGAVLLGFPGSQSLDDAINRPSAFDQVGVRSGMQISNGDNRKQLVWF
jgi:hypothetical protein